MGDIVLDIPLHRFNTVWLSTVHVVYLAAHVGYNSLPEMSWLMSCLWAHVFTWLMYTARQ